MPYLLIFRKICQKSILLEQYFQLRNYQVLVFLDMLTILKEDQSSVKLRLYKRLVFNKPPFKNSTSSFSMFS